MKQPVDLTYKRIEARIFHSYETFMDNELGQLDTHLTVLRNKYDPKRFTNLVTMEVDIVKFLTELQEEVDRRVSAVVLAPSNN